MGSKEAVPAAFALTSRALGDDGRAGTIDVASSITPTAPFAIHALSCWTDLRRAPDSGGGGCDGGSCEDRDDGCGSIDSSVICSVINAADIRRRCSRDGGGGGPSPLAPGEPVGALRLSAPVLLPTPPPTPMFAIAFAPSPDKRLAVERAKLRAGEGSTNAPPRSRGTLAAMAVVDATVAAVVALFRTVERTEVVKSPAAPIVWYSFRPLPRGGGETSSGMYLPAEREDTRRDDLDLIKSLPLARLEPAEPLEPLPVPPPLPLPGGRFFPRRSFPLAQRAPLKSTPPLSLLLLPSRPSLLLPSRPSSTTPFPSVRCTPLVSLSTLPLSLTPTPAPSPSLLL